MNTVNTTNIADIPDTIQKVFSTGCYSVRELGDSRDIIFQESSEIHQHKVKKGYLVLSKNDFGKVKTRINLGIFNKKTNFVIGEKNSLLFWDNHNSKLVSGDMSAILQDTSRYFMIYDMNFIGDNLNRTLNILDKNTKENITITLNKQFGIDIGNFLRLQDPKTTVIPKEFSILKSLIKIENSKLSINKQILINSNPDFLIGILEGYLEDSHKFILKNNINIYNFTYIFNLLGTQYSIRSLDNHEKHIRFKLPIFLKGMSNLNSVFFRNHKYFIKDTSEGKKAEISSDIMSLVPKTQDAELCSLINAGFIELVPVKDLVFIELEQETTMYDLTMPNANATNYSLPGLPLAKNSDGDILGVVALLTKDAAEEAVRKFSPELKENFLDLSTAGVQNWGVKLDSALGIYSATR
jgi:hypothetical protein